MGKEPTLLEVGSDAQQSVKQTEKQPDSTTGKTPKETAGKQSRLASMLATLVARYPNVLIIGWSMVLLAYIAVLPFAYVCWYLLPPQIWAWANELWWHWIPAFFGFVFLYAIPIWAAMLANAFAHFIADLSLSVEEKVIEEAQKSVRETEEDALARLEQTDTAGLLPLLKYSRAQLDAYYAVGLSQTKKSFFNSVLAMWLGFLLLLIGIAMYIAPIERIGLSRPTEDFQILILSGAAIIEFISALFLWVYRSTTAQLTYFYNRQIHSHTSILCFRMASTMQQEQADEAKRAIIDKVLSQTIEPERPPVVGAKGMRSLLPKS